MIKGIFGFIKWWWKGDLFSDKENGNPVPISFEQADAVAEKIAKRFEDKTWLNGVGVRQDEKHGHFVSLGIDAEMLQLKPEEFEHFEFVQMVDDVQVCLVPVETAVAQNKKSK